MKDPYYFDIQAEVGITKHAGGWKATKELADLCHINSNKYVLVVGSGTGISTNKIQKEYGCKMIGIDINPKMVKQAKKEYPNIKFQMADVQKIPFKSNTFDAVLSESVTIFSYDKLKTLTEYKRVLKPDAYIGLNEVTWLLKPRKEITDWVYKVMGAKPESMANWKRLLEKSGLDIVFAEQRKIKIFEQAVGELQLSGFTMSIKAFSRMFLYYFVKKKFRQGTNEMVKDVCHLPKGFMKHMGYGIYVAKK